MSKFQIPNIPDSLLDLAVSAEIGAETRVSVSYEPVLPVGSVRQTAADAGDYTPERSFQSRYGRDLQVVCGSAILSSDPVVRLLFDVRFDDGEAGTAIATFKAPRTSIDASANLPRSLAVDLVPEGALAERATVTVGVVTAVSLANKYFTISDADGPVYVWFDLDNAGIDPDPALSGARGIAVDIATGASASAIASAVAAALDADGSFTGEATAGVATITAVEEGPRTNINAGNSGLAVATVENGASAPVRLIKEILGLSAVEGGVGGNRFDVVSIPDFSRFNVVRCTMKKDIVPPNTKSVSIACGYDPSRWVKKGRGDQPMLDLSGKYGSYADGLARLNGHRVSVLMETYKDDRVLSERMVVGGFFPNIKITRGDGDTESEVAGGGNYETLAVFV